MKTLNHTGSHGASRGNIPGGHADHSDNEIVFKYTAEFYRRSPHISMNRRPNAGNGDDSGMSPDRNEGEGFSPPCLSLDFEVGKNDGRIHAFAAVRPDTGERLVFSGGDLAKALAKLEALAKGADFLLGHNLIKFDLPHLAAAAPNLRLLGLPAVDTLWLNPLAFPRNPYHHLVKHYQDGQLKRGRVNDPELDARIALDVFRDQHRRLKEGASPELLISWHWLSSAGENGAGFDRFFAGVRGSPRPPDHEARAAIEGRLAGAGCRIAAREVMTDPARSGWALAYALAWLSVAGGNSVMPPWVRHQFPEAGRLVRRLRDTACSEPACQWCRERHNARKELNHWFGFDNFRPEPEGDDAAILILASGGRDTGQCEQSTGVACGRLLVVAPARASSRGQNENCW